MRHFSLLLLLSFFAFSLPACAQQAALRKTKTQKANKKAAAAPAGAKANPEAGPVLTFERTPCFGTCPAYSMKVFADGRVAYEGRRFVPLTGQQELRLPATAVAAMLKEAQEAQFGQFAAHYSRGTTDLPSTIIGVRQADGQVKTVVVEEGAPDNVMTFVTYLTNQFDALAQLNGSDK